MTRYAAKTLKVTQFATAQHIHGLLELMVLLVVKLKFKEKVSVSKSELAAELQSAWSGWCTIRRRWAAEHGRWMSLRLPLMSGLRGSRSYF